ncbi:MAG: HD domain-containing protein, partial [Gallionellaceae bacterium]
MDTPIHATPASGNTANIQTLLDALPKNFSPDELASVRRACALVEPFYTGKVELTNTPLLQHALGAAAILAKMNMDCASIIAVVLHALPEYLEDSSEKIEHDFGVDVRELVEGISRMEQIRQFSEMSNLPSADSKKGDQAQQIEILRKMLLAMVQDIRVVLIKLAERTQTMRRLANASAEQQKIIARETQGIFAPLANRLG